MKDFFKQLLTIEQPPLCQKLSKALFWRRFSSSLFGSLSPVRKKLSSLLARASWATTAIQLANRSSNRQFVGILLLVSSPAWEFTYRLFDKTAPLVNGYWNVYYLVHSLRGELSWLVAFTGIFLMFPIAMKIRWFLFVPSAYKFGRIIWMLFVTSNAQYHAIIHWSFLCVGLFASSVWFILFDYLMGLHFHGVLASIARGLGIAKSTAFTDAQKVALIESELQTLKAKL